MQKAMTMTGFRLSVNELARIHNAAKAVKSTSASLMRRVVLAEVSRIETRTARKQARSAVVAK